MDIYKNTYKIIDQDIIDFRQEALRFYDYISANNFEETESTDDIIKRPYSYAMSYDFVKKHGLKIDIVKDKSEYITGGFRFFMTGPDQGGQLPPHLDHFREGIAPGTINLYLKNCDDTVSTKWWKIKSGTPYWSPNRGGNFESKISGNFTPHFPKDGGDFEVVEDKYFYDGDAVLFRTSRWHSVENKETKSRIICSFMLNSLMLWEDIVENFKANGIIE